MRRLRRLRFGMEWNHYTRLRELVYQPLLYLNPYTPPDPPDDLPPNINPPLSTTIHYIPRPSHADQQPQARQRRNRHAYVAVEPHGLAVGMRAEQLARNLAVLGAATSRGGVAAPAALPAVVVRGEKGEIVARGVVGGEIGGEEDETRGGGEEVGEVCF
ncbi:hypothetical protein G7046_g10029 [Stylonectria norvegica]|nr:hypothetical protein G7046_g10029 [Stylonectria norvegica]